MKFFQHDAPSSPSRPTASPQLIDLTFTTLGVTALIAGMMIMPSLGLSTAGYCLGLLSLVAFSVMSIFSGRMLAERAALARQKCPVRNPAQELARQYQDRHHN